MQVPGYMVPLAFLYAGLGTALGWMLGRPLVRTTNALQTAEAKFRFGLVTGAGARGGDRAHARRAAGAQRRGDRVSARSCATGTGSRWRTWASCRSDGIRRVAAGVPDPGCRAAVHLGAMSLGALMQAAQAFPAPDVGAVLAGGQHRRDRAVPRFRRARAVALRRHARLDARRRRRAKSSASCSGPSADGRLVIEDLSHRRALGRILLLEHFDANPPRRTGAHHGRPAVTGSLFKVIGGLWPWGSGRVCCRPTAACSSCRSDRSCRRAPCARRCVIRSARSFTDPSVTRSNARDSLARPAPRRKGQLGTGTAGARPAGAWLCARSASSALWIFMEEATDSFDPKGERLMFEMLHRELPKPRS